MCVRQSAGKLEIQSRNLKFSQAGVAKKKKEAEEEEDGQKKKIHGAALIFIRN